MMKIESRASMTAEPRRRTGSAAPSIGRIAGMDDDGRILVRYHQGRCNPARLVAGLNRFELAGRGCRDREVLLNFINGDLSRPVIVSLMADPLDELVLLAPDQARPDALRADDQIVTIEADREILLKCGQSSILMRKDGKIVIKGEQIVSRAMQTNKIKGACVQVN